MYVEEIYDENKSKRNNVKTWPLADLSMYMCNKSK